jgi:hypothetical protein
MNRQTLAAYWLPKVGIGSQGPMKDVYVPLTDILKYRRADGSLQIDIVNLMAATFFPNPSFHSMPIWLDPVAKKAIEDGEVAKLQAAGVKVVLTITGKDDMGWGSLNAAQREVFISYAVNHVLGAEGWNLDGIDIDDEYPTDGAAIIPTVIALRKAMPAGKVLSKALWNDLDYIAQIVPSLDYGGIMDYGDSATFLERQFDKYVHAGFRPGQLMIGVNAGPGGPGAAWTSIPTAAALAAWQPGTAAKMGMMLWSFSQDIQQFTAQPQNKPGLDFPNGNDHSWQQAMIYVMESGPSNL